MTTPRQAADILSNCATILDRAEAPSPLATAYRRTARLLIRTPPADLPLDESGALAVPDIGPKLAATLGAKLCPDRQPVKEIA